MKLVKYSAAAALLLSAGMAGFAQDADAADSKEYKTSGSLKLTQDTDPVDPIDPVDPDPEKPVVPVDPPGPGTDGPLSIDFASKLDFGEQKISTSDEVYKAKPTQVTTAAGDIEDRPNYVQITDKRGGQKGWTLQVSQSHQFKTVAEAGVAADIPLNGAVITFKNGEAVKSATSEAGVPSTYTDTFSLDPTTAAKQTVMAAKAAEGGGTWISRYGDIDTMAESIELSVPAGSLKEAATYTTELVWELNDTVPNGG